MQRMERLQFRTEVSPISYWQLNDSRQRQSSLKMMINLSHRFCSQRVLLLPSIGARILLDESFSQEASVAFSYHHAEHFLMEPRGLLYDMLVFATARLGIDLRRHPTLIPAMFNSMTRKILPWLSTNREIFSVLIKVETIGRTYLLGSGEERDTIILTESGSDMGARNKEMVKTGIKCVGVEEGAGENCSICLEAIGELGASTPCNHYFHAHCIGKWLQINHSCPICRFDMHMPTQSS